MPPSNLSQQLRLLASQWPTDPFRPNLQLQTFLLSLADHPKLTSKAVIATKALLKDELKNKYPLRPSTTRPASVPEHYKRMLEGFEKGAQGIGRPWWKRVLGIY
ncbi:hypothetical protein SISSUDRAFT_988104 [Sistotremastrum suecicum HHB10207 ss-3]|uniref:Uncharacterized protein n=1 Tax=Sistotremastrum suecicum HHB10207 ss-3 TaxID=1314776 RepID=A0A166C7K8_9AGAM|nr:hypothetical protein SISSUDRAFT_988104 [Sistotremastrum suecicum HHB10207 ss-3]